MGLNGFVEAEVFGTQKQRNLIRNWLKVFDRNRILRETSSQYSVGFSYLSQI